MYDTSKYSVIMSLYAKEKPEYLSPAIDSMLNQTIKPDEIVIVEDGPLTDELYKVLDLYKKDYPDVIRTVRCEVNIGLGLALNCGINECKNEIVARMDTDDIAKPDRCEKQLMMFNQDSELSIVGAFVEEFFDDPSKVVSVRAVPLTHEEIYEFAKRRSAFNHPVVMYRKSKVLENGGYSNLRRNQDVDLFGRMLFNGCKARNVGESLLYFRSNDDLAKRRKSWQNTISYIDTIKRFHKMGYSSMVDYLIIAIAQTGMFLMPVKLQHFIYKNFLRKQGSEI
ncbi:MAG: glycosyltransferase [Eubacteriales bacterium]|nr:glycosyltransferase [Eubacteriales bacterium]